MLERLRRPRLRRGGGERERGKTVIFSQRHCSRASATAGCLDVRKEFSRGECGLSGKVRAFLSCPLVGVTGAA